ncbi:NAD(+) diphosphatase [Falsiruegeria litorea]|uniref:NAD(+) diphosphatase n=1 Tax=Falsiruegeria litorea TaxID=1280831 RepID=UPI001BFEC0F1|nr:NAD(+) diphosphatase [Falsiruegeria litorea]MBT8167502.1 NAD(+) diphosphatase [Falsiruegeria litorea]
MTLAYANMPLDRCTHQRKNKRWVAAEFNRSSTRFCVINEGMSLFADDSSTAVYLTKGQLEEVSVNSCVYLGKSSAVLDFANQSKREQGETTNLDEQGSVFAIDFQKLRFSTQEALNELGQWLPLRQNTANLTAIDASILALAKGLVYWHCTHQYCGKCGNSSQAVEAGHARKCTECRNLSFPRTDPAVIMLIERIGSDGIARCLLGRQASWKAGMYSTLAGFVDPGETLEAAVIRETKEETDILVEKPKYITSQPWPFPASIMIGFTAQAITEAIDISQDDLEDAQWFTREQLADFVSAEQNVTGEKCSIGSGDSISSYLINAWLNKEIGCC